MARRRHRGEGSLFYSRADRCWIVRYPLGVRDGKRLRAKRRAASEREARGLLELLRRTYGAGGDPATMTLDAYLTAWLEEHGPSIRPSTLVSFRGHVRNHISPLLGGIPVARLKPADVRRLIADRLAAGCSPATVRRIVSTLHNALQQAVADRALADNPASVKLPRAESTPVTPLTLEAAARILAAAEGDRFEALYRLLLGSGLRLGEALALDQRDLMLDESYVRVRVSKTKVRAVPISADAVEALRTHLRGTVRIGSDEPRLRGPPVR